MKVVTAMKPLAQTMLTFLYGLIRVAVLGAPSLSWLSFLDGRTDAFPNCRGGIR